MVARCCKLLPLPAAVARHTPTMSGQFPSLVMAVWVHELATNAATLASGLLRPLIIIASPRSSGGSVADRTMRQDYCACVLCVKKTYVRVGGYTRG